jgi:hypothetical protein
MAINERAWAAVKKYMPTHFIGLTGPCCDHCSRALQIATTAMADDPEMDGTDFAHPAWWRGYDAATDMAIREVNEILDGDGELHGTCNEPWESLRQRLARIVRLSKTSGGFKYWELRSRT